jgi:4-amino-4-deoxy-L-arabinose transferase-like glycosyltransferase
LRVPGAFISHRPGIVRAIALAGICCLPILLYIPFLNEPLQNDEGFYATVGRIVLRGGLPYRDAFDNKPPLVFGWYALSFLIFGEHIWAPRLLVSLLLAVTTLLVYFEDKLLFSAKAGIVAALAFGLSIGIAKFGTNANTEYFLVLPMTGGLMAFTMAQEKQRSHWYLLSGLLNGVAILTKETALFPFGFLLLFAVFSPANKRQERVATVRNLGMMLIGAVLIGVVALLPFVFSGAFRDFLDAAVVYTFQYVGDTSLLGRILVALLIVVPVTAVAGPWVVLSVLAVLHARRSPEPEKYWLLAGWLCASVAGIVFAGRFFPHYFAQLLPGMSLLVPLGIRFFQEKWRKSAGLRALYSVLIGGLAVLALFLALTIYGRSSADARHLAKTPGKTLSTWETESAQLATYIRANTSADDLIYNLGFQTELYFYADRASPTRFLFDRPFAVGQGYVDEALHDLESHPPKYIIDSARFDPWEPGQYDSSGIRAFIADRYEYVGRVYYADLYRLRDDTQGQTPPDAGTQVTGPR